GVRRTRKLCKVPQSSILTGHVWCLLSMEAQHTTNRDESGGVERALVGKDRARCLTGPFPHPPRENRAYGFHHTTAHARRTSVGSSFAGLSRCIPPDYHPVSRPTTTASRLRCFPLYAVLPRSSGGASDLRVLPPVRHLTYAGFWSLLGAFPRGRFPFRALFRLGPRRIHPGSPLVYSPLSFASRARLPVSSTMDSPTWFSPTASFNSLSNVLV